MMRAMKKPGLSMVALVTVITGAVGCGAKPRQDAGVFFPTWSFPGARPGAIVSGRLIESDGCLFLRLSGKRNLPLWEEGYSCAEGALLDSSGQPVVRVGQVLHGGGGHFSKWQHAEELVGEPIPERCRPDGVEPWLLIYDVRAGPPAD